MVIAVRISSVGTLRIPPLALAPPLEFDLPVELAPVEPDDDDEGVDEGVWDPDAGGELPQPATTRAMVTSAAPSQVRPDIPNVLFTFRASIRLVIPTAE